MGAGHGGARLGAGRRPKVPSKFVPVVHSNPDADNSLSLPPEDLPVDQRDFWHCYAATAIDKGMLNKTTVAGFRLLCELAAELRAVKAVIERDGRTFIKVTVDGSGQEHQELKAHPLKADYAKLAKDVRTGLLSFGLTAFGKPDAGFRKKVAANPWGAIGGQVAK